MTGYGQSLAERESRAPERGNGLVASVTERFQRHAVHLKRLEGNSTFDYLHPKF